MSTPDKPPKPGSGEAIAMGCDCPRRDNHHGKGRYGDGELFGWLVNSTCELHRIPALDVLLKACDVDDKGVDCE